MNRKFLVAMVSAAAFASAASAQAIRSPMSLRGASGGRSLLQPQGVAAPAADTGTGASAVQADPSKTSDINFKDAALEIVLEAYSQLVEKTIIKDPGVSAVNITIQSAPGQKLTKEEQIFVILEALEMNGVHIEEYGEKFVRALPRDKVRQEGIPLIIDEEAELPDTSKVVSMFITFKNIPVDEAKTALEGLKSQKGLLLVYERIGKILVTDTCMNINRMREVARQIDVGTPVNETVFVRQIVNAAAADIKAALEQIVQESQKALENAGNAARNVQNQNNRYPMMFNRTIQPGGNLLSRNGANQPQPQASKNVESLVTSVSDADRGMIRGKVLIMSDERSNKLIVVTAKTNMDFFDKVIKELDVETTPDTVVKVYRLKYAESEDVSDMINELIGNASSSKSSSKGNQNQNARAGTSSNLTRTTPTAQSRTQTNASAKGDSKPGELTKDNTTVLADKRINGLVVMTQKELVPVVENIIESMDIKLSQVLIETVIIEVSLGDDLKTGIDWFHGLDKTGGKYNSGLAGGGGTTSPKAMDRGVSNATELVELAADALNLTPSGAGINYFVHSNKLNLNAIIKASKSDSRSKYLASPIVMTVDNKEATIEATSSYQFLTGWSAVSSSYAGSGLPSPNYTAKDLGITLKIKPKINPNGTVMLNVEEEYSQLGTKQSMLQPTVSNSGGGSYTESFVDTSVTRKMTSDIILENQQSVILGGLTTKNNRTSETGIPILKDIPWIGKWLFASTEQAETRAELLIFMTPYVLDDADAAKVEAIRRKKTLSDPTPWDDGGWSASDLSDGVSKKEQLRRIKDEWAKQDEERKTRIAIEQEKVERAKQLEKLSEEERALWIKMHKDEIEKEKRKELEKQMLDLESQDRLRALVRSIREKKLEKAEGAIAEADKTEKAKAEDAPKENVK